jgi:hypothetical protein
MLKLILKYLSFEIKNDYSLKSVLSQRLSNNFLQNKDLMILSNFTSREFSRVNSRVGDDLLSRNNSTLNVANDSTFKGTNNSYNTNSKDSSNK